MKKIIKINENDLRNLVKQTLNEVSWLTADSAVGKSEALGWTDDALKAISTLEDFLEGYVSNQDDGYCTMAVGGSQWKGGQFPNSQAAKLLKYCEEIKKFIKRKDKQFNNLQDLHDYKFRQEHQGMSKREFDDNIPEDPNEMTPQQKEYVDLKW